MWLRANCPANKRAKSIRERIALCCFTSGYAVMACLTLTLLASSLWAQTPEKPVSAKGSPHYKATVIGDKVNVRSGPGTNYYECGQLNTGDTVEVKGTQAGWSRIVPPPGSFSWIAMKYISINGDAPTIGIVTGDGIVVYAGSDYEVPMHSTTKQVTLKRGDKVALLNEEKDGYFKIVPPAGSDLWVSSLYLKREVPKPGPAVSPPPSTDATVTPEAGHGPDTAVKSDAAKPPSPAAKLLQQYKQLLEDIKAEKVKPLAKQNYTAIKKGLGEIAENKDAGRIARFSEVWLKRIELFEFGIAVTQKLELQDKQLELANNQIQNAKSQKLAAIQDLGQYAVTGTMRPSSVYGVSGPERRYRIVDENGRTKCYAKPVGLAAKTDITPYVGHKVGLVGKIKANPAAAGALVEFTRIVKL